MLYKILKQWKRGNEYLGVWWSGKMFVLVWFGSVRQEQPGMGILVQKIYWKEGEAFSGEGSEASRAELGEKLRKTVILRGGCR